MDAERLFLDTNVLLDATTPARSTHRAALALLGSGAALCASPQVVREYLVVATRPVAGNGLGLTLAQALDNADRIRGRLRLLPEGVEVFEALRGLLDEGLASGKQIHDANVVATMLAHGVKVLVTANTEHFRRFEPRIVVRAVETAI